MVLSLPLQNGGPRCLAMGYVLRHDHTVLCYPAQRGSAVSDSHQSCLCDVQIS